MRRTLLGIMLVATPALVSAQAGGRGGDSTSGTTVGARGSAKAEVSFEAPTRFSAEGKAKLKAMYEEARSKRLPPEPMARRVAEGEAKGASETAILVSVTQVQAKLETAHRTLVRAGREPRPEEVEHGAGALERGVSEKQLSDMAESTPKDRSLGVAFDVLTQLSAGGMPVANALAQIQAKLDARAPDSALLSLTASLAGRGRIGR